MITARLRSWFRPSSTPLKVAMRMDYAREPDPAWQRVLDAMHPGDTNVGPLVIAWEAGDWWQPIHRWAIYQIQPMHLVAPYHREILNGPHPRTNAQLAEVPDVNGQGTGRFRIYGPHARGIDRMRYELHHTLKRRGIVGLPRRFWCIQGDEGGQPFQLSTAEESRWAAQGRTHYAAGDLPYAEFDQRVVTALQAYDLWQHMQGLGRAQTAHVTAMLRRMQDAERMHRKLTDQKWTEFAEQFAPELKHALRKDGVHRLRWKPVGQHKERVDYDEAQHHYLTDLNTEIPA